MSDRARLDRTNGFKQAAKPKEVQPNVDPLTGEIFSADPVVPAQRPKYVMSERGISFDVELSFDEYMSLLDQLRIAEGAIQWWIGDTLNACEAAYGEKYAQAIDETQAETWRKYANVSALYKKGTRVPILSWTHYRVVAYEAEPLRSDMLKRAVKEGWSSRQLAEQTKIAKELASGDPAPEPESDDPPVETEAALVEVEAGSFEGDIEGAVKWFQGFLNLAIIVGFKDIRIVAYRKRAPIEEDDQ